MKKWYIIKEIQDNHLKVSAVFEDSIIELTAFSVGFYKFLENNYLYGYDSEAKKFKVSNVQDFINFINGKRKLLNYPSLKITEDFRIALDFKIEENPEFSEINPVKYIVTFFEPLLTEEFINTVYIDFDSLVAISEVVNKYTFDIKFCFTYAAKFKGILYHRYYNIPYFPVKAHTISFVNGFGSLYEISNFIMIDCKIIDFNSCDFNKITFIDNLIGRNCFSLSKIKFDKIVENPSRTICTLITLTKPNLSMAAFILKVYNYPNVVTPREKHMNLGAFVDSAKEFNEFLDSYAVLLSKWHHIDLYMPISFDISKKSLSKIPCNYSIHTY